MDNLCPTCIDHPGWAHDDTRRRREPEDVCRSCFGTGIDQRIPVGALVRYRGSLRDEHGYYRVTYRNPANGRYHLAEGTGKCVEGQTLANVGRASLVYIEPASDIDPEEVG